MNFCKRKVFFFGFLLLMLFGLTPNLSFAAAGVSTTNDTAKYIEVPKETDIYVNDQTIVGHLNAGAQLSAESIQNGKVYFQWDGSLAYIDSAGVNVIDAGSLTWTAVPDSQTGDRIATHGITQVFSDKDLKNAILSLEPNVNYPVTDSEGDYYRIIIGHRSGIIKASDVEFIKNESQAGNAGTVTAAPAKPGGQTAAANNAQKAAGKTVTAASFTAKDRYFKVSAKQGTGIYNNSGGSLKLAGYLNSGQVYPREADYGNWHKIKFGNSYGYIWKGDTVPVSSFTSKNLNTGLKNSAHSFIPTDNLTVYDNTSGKLVPFAVLLKNIEYPFISEYGNWYKIDVAGRIGYVYKPAAKKAFESSDRFFKVTGNNISIYVNRSGSLVQAAGLNNGQVYPRISDSGNWHKIKFGNSYGYVWKLSTVPDAGKSLKDLNTGSRNSSHSFVPIDTLSVYDNSSGSLVAFASLPKGVPYPYIAVSGNWYQVDVAGRVGYVYIPSTTRAFESSDRYFKVMSDNLGIYDNSKGSLVQVGSLMKGQVYSRIGDSGNWHKINFGNKIRYVLKSDTVTANNSTLKNENKTPVKQYHIYFTPLQDVTVYDNSSGSLVPFGVISKDVLYPAISVGGNWAQVDFSGRIGYVYTGSIKIVVGALAGKVIVLDAGHGGNDPGAIGKRYQEKTLNLNTALVVADSLRDEGATVILTRSTDTFLTLDQRVEISKQYHADAFISIHHNSLPTDPGASGIETYYYSSPKDTTLAQYVHDGLFQEVKLKDRGIKFGDYHVTRENPQPAILLELGFMSNPTEEKAVAATSFYKQAGLGITKGLINYFQTLR